MALDKKLLYSAIELMNKSHPKELHIQDLYHYIEKNFNFSFRQLSLHKQILGQIEPNWKHDLRNLLGIAKTNSTVINPSRNNWALPRRPKGLDFNPDICFDKMVKKASKIYSQDTKFECRRTNQTLFLVSYSDDKIVIKNSSLKQRNLLKSMVCSKINHLLNCGGRLPHGSLHKWGNIESAIVFLCDSIDYEGSEIIFLNSV